MKIIRRDNFDREGPGHDDYFVAFVQNEETAKKVAELLNDDAATIGQVYYQVVPDSYELYRFHP